MLHTIKPKVIKQIVSWSRIYESSLSIPNNRVQYKTICLIPQIRLYVYHINPNYFVLPILIICFCRVLLLIKSTFLLNA